jgi:carbon storage regulator
MLVLSRRVNETIQIGNAVTIKVTKIAGSRVRLGIIAPDGVPVLRGELEVEWSQNDEEFAVAESRELVLA